jgi:hypothetical protein
VLFVRGEGNVVHPWSIAPGHGGVVHGGLAAHPGRVRRAGLVLDVLGDAEAQILHVRHGAGDVGGHLVEVVQTHERARGVQVVVPREPLDVLDVVEELVREAEGILDAHRIADALVVSVGVSLHAAAEFGVERDGFVEILRAAYPIGERCYTGDRALAQDQVVVDEFLERAKVDGVLVFLGHDEVEHVDVELA